jgi:hypothetical protein
VLRKVRQLPSHDVYKDLSGRTADFKVSTEDRSILLWARGSTDDNIPVLRIDDKTRNALGVAWDSEHDFSLHPVGWFSQVAWACRASDQATRIAAWLAVLSVILGCLGLIVGLILVRDSHSVRVQTAVSV